MQLPSLIKLANILFHYLHGSGEETPHNIIQVNCSKYTFSEAHKAHL